ncbi:unnamed protein product [Leptidea sinapis]|uniref:PHD-type domain-containing protein n=1 Tax=Leptidea sinapis TaxID=189913 RepID=A0A5E4PZ08_9NEOP|nr:unnamed protein product [Leptidea sinapis]
MLCNNCNIALIPEETIKCVACQETCHYACFGIKDTDYKKMLPMNKAKWKCNNCKSKKKGIDCPTFLSQILHFWKFKLLFCFVIPAVLPVWAFGEKWSISLFTVGLRYVFCLHCTWSVNSFAHLHGLKPYDSRRIGHAAHEMLSQ